MPLAPDRVDYCPIIDRPVIKWPNNARVALWVSPNVEHYEYLPDFDGIRDSWPRCPHPDVRSYSHRDYGNRVGFWRMLETMDKHKIKCTVSLNVAVLEHFPEVRDAMVERDWDFMGHGIYNSRYFNALTEEQEKEIYRDSIETVRRLTGKEMKGILGPSITGTERTPDLMTEAGLIYHANWYHDDQPIPLKTKSGKLVSMPYSLDVNDVPIFGYGGYEGEVFLRICQDQFDQLYEEGAQSGRVMCIALHPYLIGQPHRAKYLDAALDYILSHEGVWQATGDEIAEYYIANYYDQMVAHARRLNEEAGSWQPARGASV